MEVEYLGLTIETEYHPPAKWDGLREGPGPQSGIVDGRAVYIPDGYTFDDCEEAWDAWTDFLVASKGKSLHEARAMALAAHTDAVDNNHGRITGDAAEYFLCNAEDTIEETLEDAERDYCPEEDGLNI